MATASRPPGMSAREFIFRKYDYIKPNSFATIPSYYVIALALSHFILSISGGLIFYNRLWSTWIFMSLYSTLGGMGVTAGAHRLWSHRAYKAKLPLKIILAILQTSTGFDTIYNWSILHRVHHRYSDTDADPHNVKRGFWYAHTWWLVMAPHPSVTRALELVETKDLNEDPIVYYQHRFYFVFYSLFGILVPMGVPMYFFGLSLPLAFCLCFVTRTVASIHFASFVNSAAHMFGDRPYNDQISPSDNIYISWIANGEGFHNYHHTFPWDYATSEFGFVNLTKCFIDGFARIGWAYDLKKATPKMVKNTKDKVRAHKVDFDVIDDRDENFNCLQKGS